MGTPSPLRGEFGGEGVQPRPGGLRRGRMCPRNPSGGVMGARCRQSPRASDASPDSGSSKITHAARGLVHPFGLNPVGSLRTGM